MSTGFVISAVSAVLQYFLGNALADVSAIFGTVGLSSKAPDLVQQEIGTGGTCRTRSICFCTRSPIIPAGATSACRRSAQMEPRCSAIRRWRLTCIICLRLMGPRTGRPRRCWATRCRCCTVSRSSPAADITIALGALPPTRSRCALGASGLADQLEQIKITPSPLNREEMAWLWTALKADYRPTFPFQASVVLIEAETPLGLAFPVLSRNIVANAIQPSLLSAGHAAEPAAFRRRGRHGHGHRRVS